MLSPAGESKMAVPDKVTRPARTHDLLEALAADLTRYTNKQPRARDFLLQYIFNVGFRAVVLYRLANWCAQHHFEILQTLLLNHSISATGAEIQPTATIGPGLLIHHPTGIVVGGGAVVGSYCTVLQNVTIGEKYAPNDTHQYPVIGHNVTLCAGACIIGPCKIGDDSIVGANAVVFCDVPHSSMAVGIPAKVKPRAVQLVSNASD